MSNTHYNSKLNVSITTALLIIILSLGIVINSTSTIAQPTGVNITYNVTETITPTPAASITTAGGSFTTMVLNGTFQTQKWKAYVGNVTGIISLDDIDGKTIYDWNLATISGEVYVSKNDSIDWSTTTCANTSTISLEEVALNINSTSVDSINNTFNQTIHKEFYVGTTQILNSTCYSIATYLNDTKQTPTENANFQEVLLQSQDNLIYSTILENSVLGFNNEEYDFQLIVPEDETSQTPTTYYFYAEIS